MSRCLLFACLQVLQRRRRQALRRLPQRRLERPRVRRPAALSPQARRPVSYSQSCCKSPSPPNHLITPSFRLRGLSARRKNYYKTTTNRLALRTVRVSVLSPTVESFTNRYTSTNAPSNETTQARTHARKHARTNHHTHARTHARTHTTPIVPSVDRSIGRPHTSTGLLSCVGETGCLCADSTDELLLSD